MEQVDQLIKKFKLHVAEVEKELENDTDPGDVLSKTERLLQLLKRHE